MNPVSPSQHNCTNTPTHCVFRCGAEWLALPTLSVREVRPTLEPVFVPGLPGVFRGLLHVRSEFVPLLNLASVLRQPETSDGEIMLVLDDVDGPWAVFVDEVSGLRALDISDAPESDAAGIASVVTGWATVDDEVVQVLDQSAIRQFAERELASTGRSSGLQANASTRERMGAL